MSKTVSNPKFSGEKWRVGEGSFVLSDTPREDKFGRVDTDVNYYGGHLVAESIFVEDRLDLIAAAPELYEIVEYVVKEHCWCSWPTDVGETCGADDCEDGCHMLRKARAALAKARGESSP